MFVYREDEGLKKKKKLCWLDVVTVSQPDSDAYMEAPTESWLSGVVCIGCTATPARAEWVSE